MISTSHGCWDSNWTELGRILLILMETEEVGVRKILFYTSINLSIIKALKDKPYAGLVGSWVVPFDKSNEDVERAIYLV